MKLLIALPEGDAVYECVFPSIRRNLRFGGYEKTGCCVDKTTVAPTKYPTVAPTQICYEFICKTPAPCDA